MDFIKLGGNGILQGSRAQLSVRLALYLSIDSLISFGKCHPLQWIGLYILCHCILYPQNAHKQ